MILAIHQGCRVYEGNEYFLNAIYPTPCLSKAWNKDGSIFGARPTGLEPIFREDVFDPTTRIRRGRFYVPDDPTQREWQPTGLNHYPYPQITGPCRFESYQAFTPGKDIDILKYSIIFLGDLIYKTAWRIIDAEILFNRETLFTIKSTNLMGILPEISESSLPPEKRADILENVEKVADAAHKYMPVAVVDVCREAARCILAAWLPTVGCQPKGDLADLIKEIPDQFECVKSSARVISRLHPRGKSSEIDRQAEKGTHIRRVSQEDGQLSVSLLSFLLRELRWTV